MIKTTNLLTISATAALLSIIGATEADAAIFVHIPNIPGDVTVEGYGDKKFFVADSFSFAIEREMKESGEKGGTEDINIGIGELQECSISKSMDAASAKLAQFAINGNSPGQAEIVFAEIDSTGKPIPYLAYKLDRAFVTTWSTSSESGDRPTESLSLNYNKIAFATKPTVDSGEDPDNVMSWDLKKKSTWDAVIDSLWVLLFPAVTEPPTCEEQCEERALAVLDECLASGGSERECHAEFQRVLRECLALCTSS